MLGIFPALFGVSSAMSVGTVASCGGVAAHVGDREVEYEYIKLKLIFA
jgi:hypothetical protein